MVADPFDGLPDRMGGSVVESDPQDLGMGTRRAGADVAQTAVERQEEPAVGGGSSQDRGLVRAAKFLRPSGVHVVADVTEDLDGRVGQVLIEPDPH